jgi:lipopolysaccharide/colanic/teichoic acid biosynthesis glycosyltransferase
MNVPARALPLPAAGPEPIAMRVTRIRLETDWAAALPPQAGSPSWLIQLAAKRVLDILLSLAGLIVLAPLLGAVAVLIKLTSRGPILYEWRVLGRHARPFTGYKFRTMVVDADELKAEYMDRNEMRGPVFKIRDDPRITPVGRWLRKYSIDELPQLWSVLKGDMSLVGPRPPAPEEFIAFEPWQRGKLAVTPGITCIWQVEGRSQISDFAEWAALDLDYIRRWDLWLDLRILARTLPAVLSARGAC